jgi:hypothetical protein
MTLSPCSKENANKRLEEAVQSLTRSSDATRREYDEVSRLIREYERIGSQTNITSDEKNKLAEIQNTLNNKYLTEAERLDLINGKYSDNIALLQQIAGLRFDLALADAEDAAALVERAFYNNEIKISIRDFGPIVTLSEKTTRELNELIASTENLSRSSLDNAKLVISGNAEQQAETLRQIRRLLIDHERDGTNFLKRVIDAIDDADKRTNQYINTTRDLADMQRIAHCAGVIPTVEQNPRPNKRVERAS